MTDTIAAISTPHAPGGIGIVRISGDDAFSIAKSLFRTKNQSIWARSHSPKAAYGTLQTAEMTGNARVDEAICLVFCAPRSYTSEDVAEFQCHGGIRVLQNVLQAVLAAGARLAKPGEFTQRAFRAGKMDLAQAESVLQLIQAQTEQTLRAANATMAGALSAEIACLRNQLVVLAAQLSVWMDDPDEDTQLPSKEQMTRLIDSVRGKLTQLIRRSNALAPLMGGIPTVLLGSPNVGKSTLMNLLLGFERSIVTDEAGTTRDTVTELALLGQFSLRLTDTAGVRDTGNTAERLGVVRSRQAADNAALILLLMDASRAATSDDLTLLHTYKTPHTIVLLNKTDLPAQFDRSVLREHTVVEISATRRIGLDALTDAIENLFAAEDVLPDEPILSTERQIDAVKSAVAYLDDCTACLESDLTYDALQICLEDAIQALFVLTGERASVAVVDEVFRSFCVGK